MARSYIMKPNGKTDLWDVGPDKPTPPLPPVEPNFAKMKEAELILAKAEYQDDLNQYQVKVNEYGAAKREHKRWHEENGGPIKVELWTCDADHALAIEPNRYFEKLPKGKAPGRAQTDAELMAELEAEEGQRVRRSDPQFGSNAGAMT